MSKYQVVIGNVGTVLDTDNGYEANKAYGQYVALSKTGAGKAGNESVTLIKHGEPCWEYKPK